MDCIKTYKELIGAARECIESGIDYDEFCRINSNAEWILEFVEDNNNPITEEEEVVLCEKLASAWAEADVLATLDKHWDAIVQYMDIFYRNQVHQELAPCTNLEFLRRYCELDAGFDNLVKAEFPSEIYWLI